MRRAKEFVSVFLKSMSPKYYTRLCDKTLSNAARYFLTLVLLCFLVMILIAVPKMYMLKSEFDKQILDVSKFNIRSEFQTVEPVLIPPAEPVIVLDTSNEREMGDEVLLISSQEVQYNIFWFKGNAKLGTLDFVEDRERSKNLVIYAMLFLLPSFIFYFYLIYMFKYMILILPLTGAAFLLAKLRKHHLNFSQIMTLSLYTATPMILIEVLSIPFFIKRYLLTYAPFPGINFSLIGITIYLTLFVTAIRLNENSLK